MGKKDLLNNLAVEIENIFPNYQDLYECLIYKMTNYSKNKTYRIIVDKKIDFKLRTKLKLMPTFALVENIHQYLVTDKLNSKKVMQIFFFNDRMILWIIELGLVINEYQISKGLNPIVCDYSSDENYEIISQILNAHLEEIAEEINALAKQEEIQKCYLMFSNNYSQAVITKLEREIKSESKTEYYYNVLGNVIRGFVNE